jgi:hypothetical protein
MLDFLCCDHMENAGSANQNGQNENENENENTQM